MEFRKDINGLRAVAVVLVVLFHFGVIGMEGGFLGVDVFFVISGFLMTGIILGRMEQGRFSLIGFYLDRCRRIVPALGVLCVVLAVVGWFLLLPRDYEELGTQILASLTFLSNMLFWKQDGYFEQASHDKWLLHTWSLSVEWQFYVLYPVLLLALRRVFPVAATRWFLIVLALGSFGLSVYASSRWPTSAFFLLPTRMWEMLAGALVWLFPLRTSRAGSRGLELTGVLLIIACALSFDTETVWPGWLAVLPVLGTVMVVCASRSDSLLTTNPAAQFLGRISYSLYLWHWPLAVWLFYFGFERQPAWVILALGLSVLAAWLSYRHIETAFGRAKAQPGALQSLRLALVGSFTLAVALGLATAGFHGFPSRMNAAFESATAELVMPWKQTGWCFHSVETFDELPVGEEGLGCVIGDPNAPLSGLLFGDSFAGHYDPFWDAVGRTLPARLESVSTDWCYPSLSKDYTGPTTGRGYQQCLFNREFFATNLERYDFVVLAGQWGAVWEGAQMEGVHAAIARAAARAPLVVVMPAPVNFDVNVKNMYERSLILDTAFDISRFSRERDRAARAANAQLERWADDFPNVVFLPRDELFQAEGQPSAVSAENVPFSLDESGHISIYGARVAARVFLRSRLYRQISGRVRRLDSSASLEQVAGGS